MTFGISNIICIVIALYSLQRIYLLITVFILLGFQDDGADEIKEAAPKGDGEQN